jgi:hypothetical protein
MIESTFRSFELVKTNELFVTRHKWFFPYYELTDGQFVYGKLSYHSSFRRHAVIEAAQGTWTVKHKGWFKKGLLINRGEDDTVGNLIPETWKRNINLKMDDGFEAVFLYKKLFTTTFTLNHDMYGDILNIKQKAFGIKKPFVLNYDQALKVNNMPPIPLLALIAINLILIRQTQSHAAGAH